MIFKKPHYIALAAVVLLTVAALRLPTRTATQVRRAVGSVFAPSFGVARSAEKLAEKAANSTVPRQELVRQVDELEKQNRELRIRAMQWDAISQENQRLRQQLGLARQHPNWNLKFARVVARDPANWWRSLRIDLGSRDGVVTNTPVLTPQGLAGRVSEVGFTQSQVVLLGDPDCRVAVLIEGTRDHGVIAPDSSGGLDETLVDISFVSRGTQLKAGQKVITSGLGGIFPKGIPVGHVVDSRSAGYGLYVEARAKLAVNLNTLEEVWVKMP